MYLPTSVSRLSAWPSAISLKNSMGMELSGLKKMCNGNCPLYESYIELSLYCLIQCVNTNREQNASITPASWQSQYQWRKKNRFIGLLNSSHYYTSLALTSWDCLKKEVDNYTLVQALGLQGSFPVFCTNEWAEVGEKLWKVGARHLLYDLT